jgi:hypothetical protein
MSPFAGGRRAKGRWAVTLRSVPSFRTTRLRNGQELDKGTVALTDVQALVRLHRVNPAPPYGVDAPMTASTFCWLAGQTGLSVGARRKENAKSGLSGRYTLTCEIARVCSFLASDVASYVSCASIHADAGTSTSALSSNPDVRPSGFLGSTKEADDKA